VKPANEIVNDRFELIPCPVCGNRDLRPYFEIAYGQLKQKRSLDYTSLGVTPDTRLYVKSCPRCGLVFVNPRIRPELEDELYNRCKNEMYVRKPHLVNPGDETYALEALKRRLPRSQILMALLSHVPLSRPPVFFDFGCGFGDAMSLAKALGMTAYGVDIDQRRLEVCQRQGLDVARPDEFDVRHPGVSADVLMMESTIEHLVDLNATFRFLRSKARPGAVLFVNGLTPRIISIERRRNQFTKAHFLEHINYFPVPTLDRFLASHGFKPLPFSRGGVVSSVRSLLRLAGSFAMLAALGENVLGGSFTRFYRHEPVPIAGEASQGS